MSLTLTFILAFSAALAQAPTPSPTHKYTDYTYEKMVQDIRTHNIRSVDQLTEILPAELRSYYVLMYESRSLMSATYEEPRVILRGIGSKFILSFNGETSTRRSDSVELIQYRDQTQSFEFREVTFPTPANQLTDVAFSEPNPKRCLGCHRSDPRPNWEHYSQWPGAYGGHDDDNLEPQFHPFLASVPNMKRYRHLLNLKEQFADGGALNRIVGQNNQQLLHELAILNYQRIIRLMKSSGIYNQYKYALLGMLAYPCKVSVSSFLPERIWQQHAAIVEWPTGDGSNRIEDIFRFIFTPKNIDITDWYMDFIPGPNNSFITPINNNQEVVSWMIRNDSDLAGYFDIRLEQYTNFTTPASRISPKADGCNRLINRSLSQWQYTPTNPY
jgi:hypothetical protein